MSGNGGYHTIRLIRASDRIEVASVALVASAGQYRYAPLGLPTVLAANTTYYLVSSEDPGGDTFHDNATVSAAAGLTVNARVQAVYGNPSYDTTTWTFSDVESGARTFGPVNMRYAIAPVGTLAYPPDPSEGAQAAWIAGTGEMSQQIFFPRAGTYALRMLAAGKENALNTVRFFFDNTIITPDGSSHAGARAEQWGPGEGFARDYRYFQNNTTYVFTVPGAGAHIRFRGLDDLPRRASRRLRPHYGFASISS